MKKLVALAIISLFVSSDAFSQSFVHCNIPWNEIEGDLKTNPDALPDYYVFLEGDVRQYKITNPKYESISYSISQDKEINSAIQVQKNHLTQRKKTKTMLTITPLRRNNGRVEKLISFDLQYNTQRNSSEKRQKKLWKIESALKSGTWYKMAVTSSGIHKIDYDFIQNQIGVNPSTIDPRKIKIYGSGGKMLPQPNAEDRIDDLEENDIMVAGESDGVFNISDYILFYGEGTETWGLNSDSTWLGHTTNIYADTSYYFITFEGDNGSRISSLANSSGATATFTEFDAFFLYEKDEINIIKSGRSWYSDKFDFELNQSFSFNLPGYVSGSDYYYISAMVGGSPKASTFDVSVNGALEATQSFNSYGGGDYHPAGRKNNTKIGPLSQTNTNVVLDYTYNTFGAAEAVGYVDYFEFNYDRKLKLTGNEVAFRVLESLNQQKSAYQIEGCNASTLIWNITDPMHPKSQEFVLSGSTAEFTEDASDFQEYVVFAGSNFDAPHSARKVENQDLHGMEIPEMLIVTHPLFLDQAQRLADFRASNDGMDVEVVEVGKIYNEFSCGKQDISAIRDFCKMFYDRDTEGKFKYLLLFGDCSYDYKNRISGNTNFIPVYEAIESLSPTATYSSDDYFGFLDDNEGRWREAGSASDLYLLDIGIGRIICTNTEEAGAIVDKIEHYSTNCDILGKWRNEVTLIADDGDNNIHLVSAESYAVTMDKNYPVYNINKIFLDAFGQEPTATGQSASAVNDAIDRKIKTGSLITNYTGHGGETGLAHESILTVDQINSWENFDNLTLMFTATCEFGRYDDPGRVSAGEYTLLNPQGGAIAIITTSRPVYSGSNTKINRAFFNNVFKPMPDSITMPRLGDLMIATKNNSLDGMNNRNFTLLGDPSLRLAYPKDQIVLTTVNDSIIYPDSDTLKALSKVKFEGYVQGTTGNKLSDYSGMLDVTVFDKRREVNTLGDESASVAFQLYNDIIFRGKSSIDSGNFTFTFVVPKDISYQYGNGKISLYAQTTNKSCNTDAHGFSKDIVIGGSNPNAAEDDTPPEAETFMDDFSFVFGGMTGTDPVFLAKLYDENGINTAGSGIGHEITAVLDDDWQNTFVLNEYYTTELNDYKNGTVEYPLFGLESGLHNIKFKAWDVYNNSVEDYLEFVVVDESGITISNLLNYPNPFTTGTEFHFDHNRVGDDLDVKIQIFTLSGKVVKTIHADTYSSSSHITTQKWDGKDQYGSQLARGVYIYKVSIIARSDNAKTSQYEKLLLLK